MAYKYGNREQVTFLPDRIESYVKSDDPVRAYDAFIEALDLKSLNFVIDSNLVGNSAYDPISMLKVLVYAYSYGWRSSRKIERALHHNLSFIWLAGALKPDHKTISNFRKENKSIFKNILKECAQICYKLKLIEGNTLFLDGSKFRANAGNRQTKSKETWEKVKVHVEEGIDSLLKDCDKIDSEEPKSLIKMDKELKSKEKLKLKIESLLTEMNDKSKDKINGTDPNCKIMRGRQGSHAGYNGQIVVDEKHGLIAGTEVNAEVTDANQMERQIKNAEDILGKECKNACADAGYASVEDLNNLLGDERRIIVPSNVQAQRNPKDKTFAKKKFIYNKERNIYICPEGKELHKATEAKKKHHIIFRMKDRKVCRSCEHFGLCTSSKHGRSIARLRNEETKEYLEKIYESEKGQEIYSKRKMKVELPFGHIKRNLGANYFLLRGFEGVNAEFSILASCFNLARMLTILGGVRPMIEKLKTL